VELTPAAVAVFEETSAGVDMSSVRRHTARHTLTRTRPLTSLKPRPPHHPHRLLGAGKTRIKLHPQGRRTGYQIAGSYHESADRHDGASGGEHSNGRSGKWSTGCRCTVPRKDIVTRRAGGSRKEASNICSFRDKASRTAAGAQISQYLAASAVRACSDRSSRWSRAGPQAEIGIADESTTETA